MHFDMLRETFSTSLEILSRFFIELASVSKTVHDGLVELDKQVVYNLKIRCNFH
jgi:hypothetical protein